MKTRLIALSIILSQCFLYAQTSFPTSDAIWNVQESWNKELYYGLKGDTIINDTTYSKLYLLNDTTLNIDQNDIYIGGIRQKDQKVWFRLNVQNHYVSLSHLNSDWSDSENSFETLLYDFSKNKADTVWQNFYIQGLIYAGKQKALSVISDVTNTNNLKTYQLNQYINIGSESVSPFLPIMGGFDTWIEGVGSLRGLFWFLYSPPMSGGNPYKLNCLKQGNNIKYIDKDCTSCFKYSTTNISDNKYSSVSVLVNNSLLTVKAEASVFPCQIKLYNVLGQLRLSKTIYTDNESINIPKKTGDDVYLYQLIDKKDGSMVKTGKLFNH